MNEVFFTFTQSEEIVLTSLVCDIRRFSEIVFDIPEKNMLTNRDCETNQLETIWEKTSRKTQE